MSTVIVLLCRFRGVCCDCYCFRCFVHRNVQLLSSLAEVHCLVCVYLYPCCSSTGSGMRLFAQVSMMARGNGWVVQLQHVGCVHRPATYVGCADPGCARLHPFSGSTAAYPPAAPSADLPFPLNAGGPRAYPGEAAWTIRSANSSLPIPKAVEPGTAQHPIPLQEPGSGSGLQADARRPGSGTPGSGDAGFLSHPTVFVRDAPARAHAQNVDRPGGDNVAGAGESHGLRPVPAVAPSADLLGYRKASICVRACAYALMGFR